MNAMYITGNDCIRRKIETKHGRSSFDDFIIREEDQRNRESGITINYNVFHIFHTRTKIIYAIVCHLLRDRNAVHIDQELRDEN